MIKMSKKISVTWPIVLSIAIDGGRTKKETANVKFEFDVKEHQKIADTAQTKINLKEIDAFVKKTIVGWDDGELQDADGKGITYSEASKAELLSFAPFRNACQVAIGEIAAGKPVTSLS